MTDLRELYQEVILDHNKAPRNFRKIPAADRSAQGVNPLCGDHLDLYVMLDDDTITDVSFEGEGCAISKSSASLMTTMVKGKTLEEAKRLFDRFRQVVTTPSDQDLGDITELGKLAVFAGVREYPARVKCASLCWHTLNSALEKPGSTVTTE